MFNKPDQLTTTTRLYIFCIFV